MDLIHRIKRGYAWPEIISKEAKERLEENDWGTFLIIFGVVALVILLTYLIYKVWRWTQTACVHSNGKFQKLQSIDSIQFAVV